MPGHGQASVALGRKHFTLGLERCWNGEGSGVCLYWTRHPFLSSYYLCADWKHQEPLVL